MVVEFSLNPSPLGYHSPPPILPHQIHTYPPRLIEDHTLLLDPLVSSCATLYNDLLNEHESHHVASYIYPLRVLRNYPHDPRVPHPCFEWDTC